MLVICLRIFPLYSFRPKHTTTSISLSKSDNWMLVSKNRMPHSISSVVIPNWCFMFNWRFLTTPDSATSLQAVKTLLSFSYWVIISRYRLVNLCKSISVWTPFMLYASEWANGFGDVIELILSGWRLHNGVILWLIKITLTLQSNSFEGRSNSFVYCWT